MVITEEVLSFIEQERKRGISDEKIKRLLIEKGGWEEKDLKEAFDSAHGPDYTPSPAPPPQPQNMEGVRVVQKSEQAQTAASTPPSARKHSPSPATPNTKNPPPSTPTPNKTKRAFRRLKMPSLRFLWSGGKMRVVGIALLLLLGGAAVGYTAVSWERWTTSEEDIIATALTNLAEASSFSFNGLMSINSHDGGGVSSGESFIINVQGTTHTDASENGAATEVSLAINAKRPDTKTGQRTAFDVSADVKLIGHTLYFILSDLPDDMERSFPIPEGRWMFVQLNNNVVDSYGERYGISSEAISEGLGGTGLAVAAVRAAKDAKLYSIDSRDPQRIEGQDMHVYNINIHAENIQKFSKEFAKEVREHDDVSPETRERVRAFDKEMQELTDEDIERMQKVLRGLRIVVMVGQEDQYPYRVLLSFSREPMSDDGGGSGRAGSSQNLLDQATSNRAYVDVSFQLNFSSFNEALPVKPPLSAIDLEEAMLMYLTAPGTDSTSTAPEEDAADEGIKIGP